MILFTQYNVRFELEITTSNKINHSKHLIYNHEYNIPEIDDYCSDLKKEYNISDVQKATWIKTRIITPTPLLTFKEK